MKQTLNNKSDTVWYGQEYKSYVGNAYKTDTKGQKRTAKKLLSSIKIIQSMKITQTDAANMLGVSVSTLKRRYYKLGLGRWPANRGTHHSKHNNTSIHTTLQTIINQHNVDEKYIDDKTEALLAQVFSNKNFN
ncbi:hypothetical protein AKO1_009276 [Acrasis kona]|uniref:RWP-RK domain-containing protein n=1 Tax=Acrasis kona TaxID=1008807 RepID=A0AAW2ZM69_9EUKA